LLERAANFRLVGELLPLCSRNTLGFFRGAHAADHQPSHDDPKGMRGTSPQKHTASASRRACPLLAAACARAVSLREAANSGT
jgi:hypothetical protein